MSRMQHRLGNGRWRRTTLADFGVHQDDVNHGQRFVCECGYGDDGSWEPILLSGVCPACERDEKRLFVKEDLKE